MSAPPRHVRCRASSLLQPCSRASFHVEPCSSQWQRIVLFVPTVEAERPGSGAVFAVSMACRCPRMLLLPTTLRYGAPIFDAAGSVAACAPASRSSGQWPWCVPLVWTSTLYVGTCSNVVRGKQSFGARLWAPAGPRLFSPSSLLASASTQLRDRNQRL